MFTNWLVLTILICATIYLIVMLFYYKTLLNKEKHQKILSKTILMILRLSLENYKFNFKEALEI